MPTLHQFAQQEFRAALDAYKAALRSRNSAAIVGTSMRVHAAKGGVPKRWHSLVGKAFRFGGWDDPAGHARDNPPIDGEELIELLESAPDNEGYHSFFAHWKATDAMNFGKTRSQVFRTGLQAFIENATRTGITSIRFVGSIPKPVGF